jgi:hypothetical protein
MASGIRKSNCLPGFSAGQTEPWVTGGKMRAITRWTLAVLALVGFHSAVAQTQRHSNLHTANHANITDISAVAEPVSDGSWYP